MKRIFLTAIGIGLLLTGLKAQSTAIDSSAYKSRKLKIDEINLVSSYYSQNGHNAAVTGGIGTEKLNDIANVIDVTLSRYDKRNRKHLLAVELGIDYYTSASSDLIDLKANSSASHQDARIYPTISYSIENEVKGTIVGTALSSSSETDYESLGGNLNFSLKTKNRNGEFTAKLQTYLDQVSIIEPIELRTPASGEFHNYPKKPRNTYAASASYSQIINERLQIMLLADVIKQTGYLSLPFHRVYFNDGSVHQENLPNNRLKIPIGIRANYFLGDKFIIKTYYRFYQDDWGLIAHTADIEVPVKITPFVSVSPFYRYYNQSAIKYFAPYESHTVQDQYYVSNYDLSKFNSNFFGAGVRIAPPKGVFGKQHLA